MIKAKDLESMAGKLEQLGLPFKEIFSFKEIDKNSDELRMTIRRPDKNENVTYRFCIKKESSGDYVIHDYEAKRIFVPIDHGFHAGVDTQKLENDMRKINWELIQFQPKADMIDVMAKLDQLKESGQLKAREILDKLAIRYFSNTPLQQVFSLPDITPYLKTILIPIHNNGNDVDIYQALQLLRGETFIKYVDPKNENGEICWLKEDKGYIKVYPDFDIASILKQIPLAREIDIMEESEILAGFGKGRPYEASILINKRIVHGSISVDPAGADLKFQNSSGQSVNWRLWAKIDQNNKRPGNGKKGPGL